MLVAVINRPVPIELDWSLVSIDGISVNDSLPEVRGKLDPADYSETSGADFVTFESRGDDVFPSSVRFARVDGDWRLRAVVGRRLQVGDFSYRAGEPLDSARDFFGKLRLVEESATTYHTFTQDGRSLEFYWARVGFERWDR